MLVTPGTCRFDLFVWTRSSSAAAFWVWGFPPSQSSYLSWIWQSAAVDWQRTQLCRSSRRCWWAGGPRGCLRSPAAHPSHGCGGCSGGSGRTPGSFPVHSSSNQTGDILRQTAEEEEHQVKVKHWQWLVQMKSLLQPTVDPLLWCSYRTWLMLRSRVGLISLTNQPKK